MPRDLRQCMTVLWIASHSYHYRQKSTCLDQPGIPRIDSALDPSTRTIVHYMQSGWIPVEDHQLLIPGVPMDR